MDVQQKKVGLFKPERLFAIGWMLVLVTVGCGDDSSSSNPSTDSDSHPLVDTELPYTTTPSTVSCIDNSAQFTFGVSSFGQVRQWALDANQLYGANFHYLYVYILDGGMENADDFRDWYIRPFIEAAQSIDAVPLFTFYQLLDIGYRHGYSGTEMEVVQASIEDSTCMNDYFSNFVWFLQVLNEYAPQAIVQVEPDSWGFMMWAMGIEGNDDPSSVAVQVAGSGFADVAGFENTAAGLGKALLSLRDRYAPEVRMGWHTSNFRVGTRPEVVTSFYAEMGNWDLLVGEGQHNHADGIDWWEPWDEELYQRNLDWISTVTAAAGIPMILWQIPVGDMDYHFLGDESNRAQLSDYAAAGVIAILFEHANVTGEQDPDDYRGFTAIPPDSIDAGGTAKDMRERVAAYAANPLPLPAGSICLQENNQK